MLLLGTVVTFPISPRPSVCWKEATTTPWCQAKALFPVAEMAFCVSPRSILCGPQRQVQALNACSFY